VASAGQMESAASFSAAALRESLPWIGLLLAGAAFVADLTLPLHLAVGACYALSVLTTVNHPRRSITLGMAMLITAMIIIGMVSDHTSPFWVNAASRGAAVTTVWVAALLSLAFSRLNVRVRDLQDISQTRQVWLAQTLASISDGVIACDATGRIEFMNAVAEQLTGWRESEAVGCDVDEIFAVHEEKSGRRVTSPVRRALESGEIVNLSGHWLLHGRDGRSWPLDDSASAIHNEHGEITGAVMVFRDVSERRRGEKQMDLRLREAGHRIRNVFANVQAILSLCARSSDSPTALVECVESRMASLMRSTERLIQASEDGSSLREIVIGEIEPYLGYDRDRLHFAGSDVLLSSEASISLGMIVHELATNASKYGSLSAPAGRVEVRCDDGGNGRIEVTWNEMKGPAVTHPGQKGMGSRVIDGLVKTQFSGHWEPIYMPHGFMCHLRLNVGERRPRPAEADDHHVSPRGARP
jgi:PAS domain S-box-containing protein